MCSIAFKTALVDYPHDGALQKELRVGDFSLSQLQTLNKFAQTIAQNQAGTKQVLVELKRVSIIKPRCWCVMNTVQGIHATCTLSVNGREGFEAGPKIDRESLPPDLLAVVEAKVVYPYSRMKVVFE